MTVSLLTHFNDFWDQKLIYSVSFWPQKSLKWVSIFSGPRNCHILSVSGPKSVSRILANRNRKKIMEPETDEMCQFLGQEMMLTHFNDFWGQKLTECVSFWAQKSLKWASKVSGPKNWHYGQEILYAYIFPYPSLFFLHIQQPCEMDCLWYSSPCIVIYQKL